MFGLFAKPKVEAPAEAVPEPSASAGAYIGEIRQFAFDFTPIGWAPCDGALLRINEHMGLYAAIGPKYGGDGVNSFALPNIPPTAAGIVHCIALQGMFPQRAQDAAG